MLIYIVRHGERKQTWKGIFRDGGARLIADDRIYYSEEDAFDRFAVER